MNFTNNEGDSDREGGVLHGDDIITLVIRKSLLIPKGDSDKDWRRNNIFHSTCIIKDIVCSLIIDSWSYKNLVSTKAVRKLQLPTKNQPYKLTWLNSDTEVIMDRRYLVFSLWVKNTLIMLDMMWFRWILVIFL